MGIEVMTFARLRMMAPPGRLSKPLRPSFHSLLFVDAGETVHTLDFVRYPLKSGSGLRVRPGQVQSYGDDRCTGDLVLFQPDFLIPDTLAAAVADDRYGAAMAERSPSRRAARDRFRRALRREYAGVAHQGAPTPAQIETLRHLLSAVILSWGVPIGEQDGRGDQTRAIARFRELLERDFATAHSVGHYARELGYSPRTLERATQAVDGESPKQAINRRIVLEARRLLAFTNRPVGVIARELGFRDPSNFSTFFTQESGETPTGFRRTAR